jgi:putative oxidoreductase
MSIFEPARKPWTSRMLSVLRMVAGLIFFSTGTMKLFGFPPPPSSMPPFGLLSQLGVAGFPVSVFPTVNNGVPAVLYCFIYLYLTLAGAGEWSVDAQLARPRGGRPL